MCQPKSKGGKRCLKHHKLSQFSTRMVQAKTGADEELVNSTLKELSREGKNLPPVAQKEVETFIETRRFATEIDPQLDSHERKIQLRQLENAKKDIQNGTDGGHFHAWKNLLSRVSAKMQNMKKKLLVISLAGSLSLGLASCSGGIQPNVPEETSPSPTSSAPADEEVIRIGDAVLSGETVTDEYGSYAKTTISPDDDSMQYNASIVDASATDRFSQEEILSGQQFVSRFIAEEGLDSIALEGQEAKKSEWANTVANEYIDPRYREDVLAPSGSGNVSTVIVQGGNATLPVLVRDGKARLSGQSVQVEKVVGFDEGDLKGLSYLGTASATYRASDAASIEYLQRINPETSLDKILEETPALKDNAGENLIAVKVEYRYSLVKDPQNLWLIGGYQNDVYTNFIK